MGQAHERRTHLSGACGGVLRVLQSITPGPSGCPSTIHDRGSRGAPPCRNSTRTTSLVTAIMRHVVPSPQSSVSPRSSLPSRCAWQRCRIVLLCGRDRVLLSWRGGGVRETPLPSERRECFCAKPPTAFAESGAGTLKPCRAEVACGTYPPCPLWWVGMAVCLQR